MRRVLLVITLIIVNLGTGFAQKPATPPRPKAVIVAFLDEPRIRSYGSDGQTTLENYTFFLKPIQEIAKRDFPDVEFKVLRRGELFRLSDGTGLNVQNMQPLLGYVFSMRGKKRRVLSGVQSDLDFACAASTFFHRPSLTCSK
jgi:hypothetical protein